MFARAMREQTAAGVTPAAPGAYRLVTIAVNGESIKAVRDSRIIDGQSPPIQTIKPGSPLVLALPRREVIVKTIRVPSTDRRQIAQMVPFEASTQLPWPPEESIVAFDIQDSTEPEYAELVLFMCRKETVQAHLAALKKLGLAPSRIEPAFVSLGRLAVHAPEQCPAFFIAGASGIEYARYACGRNVFTRGTSPDEIPAEVLAHSIEIDAHTNGPNACSAVYLAGDAAPDPDQLARDAKLAIPLKSVANIPGADAIEPADAVCVAAALGGSGALAAAGPNLLPEREMRLVVLRHIFRQGRIMLAAAAWLILVLAGIGYCFFSRELARATRAEAQIQAIQADVGNLKEQYDALQLLAGERARVSIPLQVILELYRLTPQNIAINSFVYDSRKTLSFGGEAPSFRAAWEYMDALLKSKMFADVEMRHAAKPQPGKEELVEFKVTCTIHEAK
ncbi:MAG: PilN domain-containing protein [Candidatus Hydrogenedentes bacterium]|nr:PilN domain-containing protein [Candidatus Hydrogenedentota bacterium]